MIHYGGSMLRAVFICLVLSFSAWAEEVALVKVTDTWRVKAVPTNAPGPGPNWAEVDFPDSGWANQLGSFDSGSKGYLSEQTYLDPTGITTYCFRKTFTVADPDFVRWLTLRIDYSSGFVAYLNGVEMARRGFPNFVGQPVPLGEPAAHHPPNPTEWIDVSAAIPGLRAGANVLAIQLHSAGTVNRGLLMATELLANFTRGPFVQNTTTNSTIVAWHTGLPTTGFVIYGKDVDHLYVAGSGGPASTNHAVRLTGLEAGASYQYRVYAERGGDVAASDWATFRALKPPGAPISFLVTGDTGVGTFPQYKIAEQMRATPADLLMHCGDIVYPYLEPLHVDARCFSIYRDQMRSVPFFFSLGNHDGIGGQETYLNTFFLPTNNVTGTEHYYSFDHGDAHFVVLAVDTLVGNAFNRYEAGSPQYNWLDLDLATTRQPWKFIFFHHVIRSSSFHSSDDYLADGIPDMLQLRSSIGLLAERHGAQIIFNGHDHAYERFGSFNGVNNFITGGGGAGLYGIAGLEPGSMQFHFRYHFLRVSIDGPDLMVEAIDHNKIVFDRFYRSLAGAGETVHPAAWGTPMVEATAGDDPSGNILGQVFNFEGGSARTRAGLHANLGRLHVRNDRVNLYLGLESAAVRDNQVIALFVENPAEPGVTDLAPLGNNQPDLDGAGEGVDALDLLGKLEFKDFRPSLACLLGDEHADGNFRNFRRPGMRWSAGQGVFRLDAGFSTVAGARIQQFNRTPQGIPTQFPEANADMIEVAIPLAALGRPSAPGLIRVGAVALADLGSGPMEPMVDTAFAGRSLEPGTDGRMVLEPMAIALAPDPTPSQDEFSFRGEFVSGTQIRFHWNSAQGRGYRLQLASTLGEAFVDVEAPGLPLTATGPSTAFVLTVDPPGTARFYRLAAD